MLKISYRFAALAWVAAMLSGCTVLAVADAVASTAVGVVTTSVKVGTAVVGTAIDVVTPSDDEKK